MGMTDWLAGLSRAVITPTTPVWLAGYGSKRVPEGTVHDLWVKVLAVADAHDKATIGPGGNLQAVGQALPVHHQGVVADGL